METKRFEANNGEELTIEIKPFEAKLKFRDNPYCNWSRWFKKNAFITITKDGLLFDGEYKPEGPGWLFGLGGILGAKIGDAVLEKIIRNPKQHVKWNEITRVYQWKKRDFWLNKIDIIQVEGNNQDGDIVKIAFSLPVGCKNIQSVNDLEELINDRSRL